MKEFRRKIGLWLCRNMKWHKPGVQFIKGEDYFQWYSRCTKCGFEGMMDSQGNLF